MTTSTHRVLIVEDEHHLAEGLRFNLEAEGFEAEVVDTGEAALARLAGPERRPYDVVVLDVMLPGKDGFAVVSRQRAQRFIQHRLQVLPCGIRGIVRLIHGNGSGFPRPAAGLAATQVPRQMAGAVVQPSGQ